MRTRPWTILAVAIAALVLSGCGDDDDDDDGPAAASSEAADDDTELPEVDAEVGDASADYLRGDGASLLALVNAAEAVVAAEAACAETAALLNAELSPDEALERAAAVEDEPLREALLAQRAALLAVLADCTDGEARERLIAVTEVVAARLDEIGVQR